MAGRRGRPGRMPETRFRQLGHKPVVVRPTHVFGEHRGVGRKGAEGRGHPLRDPSAGGPVILVPSNDSHAERAMTMGDNLDLASRKPSFSLALSHQLSPLTSRRYVLAVC